MDDYISKPVRAEVLRQKLERWTAPGETAFADEDLSGAPVPAGNRGGVIDQTQLASLRAIQEPGKEDFVTELIDLFVNVTVAQMKVLHEAVVSNDLTSIRRVAHFMIGSSANVGARQMAALFEQLEGQDGENGDNEVLLARLDQEFELVCEALKAERRETADLT
jgi:HPt (histidine-containing phosphotransfer) domain-containing protein